MTEDIGKQLEQIMKMTPGARQFLSASRTRLFTVLHEIVFYGKGGYDFDTVYNMPIWLRKFIYNSINKHYEEEAKQAEAASKGKSVAPKMPSRPGVPNKTPDLNLKSRK